MTLVSRRAAIATITTTLLTAIAADAAAQTRMQAKGPQLMLRLPWGAMGATVGRHDGIEGASEGPMSFALAGSGAFVVLDQVNGRLAWFDRKGTLMTEWSAGRTFQELEVWPDGSVVLLDRLARQSLVVLDPAGGFVREVGLVGKGIREGGMVTGMFAEPDGIWLEVGHVERVQLLDAALKPSKRRIRRGRRFDAGRELMAELDGGGARLWMEDRNGRVVASQRLTPALRIARVIWLEADAQGQVHALFHLLEVDPVDVSQVLHEEVLGMLLDDQLRPLASYHSPHVIQIWEQFREVRIARDGSIYQMAFDAAGMRIVRWTW